jgi:hypothetical protein
MSYPTGMGAATGNHYNNVAAQMHAYLNNGGGGHLHSAYGQMHQFQPSQGVAFASNAFHSGAQHLGVDPLISNDVGGFARRFMRNLMH